MRDLIEQAGWDDVDENQLARDSSVSRRMGCSCGVGHKQHVICSTERYKAESAQANEVQLLFAFAPNIEAEKLLSADYQAAVDGAGLRLTKEVLNRFDLNERKEYDTVFADTWAVIWAE